MVMMDYIDFVSTMDGVTVCNYVYINDVLIEDMLSQDTMAAIIVTHAFMLCYLVHSNRILEKELRSYQHGTSRF